MGRPPCCDKVGIKKGPWTPEEDIILVSYIQEHGPGNWRSVPTNTGLLRCSKSCRLRWTNYLRPGIKRGNFTSHEEGMIIHLQALLGNKWAAIASYLPQRTDNDIKNYWNTHLKKKLKKLQSAMDSQDQSESSTCQHIESSETLIGINKGSSSTYASSTENISRLLEGWMRSSPITSTTDQKQRKSFEINSNGGLMGSLSSSSSSSRIQILGLKSDSRDEFDDSIISFENLKNGSCSWDDKEINVGDEKLKQRSENASPPPLSFLEKWLFEETGAGQVDELMELSPVY